MSLVTELRYRAITGDTATADGAVTARIEEATDLLEEFLERPLESAVRTEAMWPDRIGVLRPLATPITVAADYTIGFGGMTLTGTGPFTSVLGAPFGLPAGGVSVVYTGGFVERTANPTAAHRLPAQIERDIAWAAYAIGHRDAILAGLPAGAASVSVGDVSVSFTGGARGSGDDMTIRWSATTRRYRRRTL